MEGQFVDGAPSASPDSERESTGMDLDAVVEPEWPSHAPVGVITMVNPGHMSLEMYQLTGGAAVARHGLSRRRAGPIPCPVDRVLSPATHRPFRWNPEF